MNVHPLPVADPAAIADGAVRIVTAMLAQKGSKVDAATLPGLVQEVARSLACVHAAAAAPGSAQLPGDPMIAMGATEASARTEPFEPGKPLPPRLPVVDPKASVTPYRLVCLADGVSKRMLKRHVRAKYGMTWQQYLEWYGLDSGYPSIAPAVAAGRSAKARSQGLGWLVDKTPRSVREAREPEAA